MPNLIERLNRAIDVEYDWKNQEVAETLKTPIADRVKGDTIEMYLLNFFLILTMMGVLFLLKLK